MSFVDPGAEEVWGPPLDVRDYGIAAVVDAARTGVASANAACNAYQADAARFVVEHGQAVVDGHADVGTVGG